MASHLNDELRQLMASFGIKNYTDETHRVAAETEARIAREDHAHRMETLMRRMGAPDFLIRQLRTRRQTQATQATSRLGPGFLVLGGGVGTGKSMGGMAWLWSAPGPILYLDGAALSELSPWKAKPWVGKRSILLDDVGTEHSTASQRVEELVTYAHGRCSCTLVMTTNLTMDRHDGVDGFRQRYGKRVERRLRERPAHPSEEAWITITGL